MGKPLRVLNIEDSESDAILLERHLAAAGYDVSLERVHTKNGMEATLKSDVWDVVLCDYTMPGFDALGAYKVLLDSGHDIPFIIISGTVGEERAVDALLNGAHDFIPKSNLTRLIPAIERELTEAENRRERRAAEEELRLSEGRYRELFEYAPDGIIIASPESYYLNANPGMCKMLGYQHSELIGMHATDIVAASETKDLDVALAEVMTATEYSDEWSFKRKDGSKFVGHVIARILPDGNLLTMVRDITERKVSEEKLNRSQANLSKAQQIAHLGSWEMDLPLEDGGESPLRWSDEVFRIFGYRAGEIEVTNENFFLAAHPDDRENIRAAMATAINEGQNYSLDHRIILPDGSERIVHEHSEIVFDQTSGKPIMMIGTVQDITERKRAEADIQRRQTELRVLFDVIPAMIWFKDTENNILRVNKQVAQAAGRSVAEIEGKSATEIYSESAANFYSDDLEVIGSGKPKLGYEEMIPGANGTEMWIQTDKVPYFDKDGKPIGIVVMAQDVTERKGKEAELHRQRTELRALLDYIPAMICFKDTNNGIVRANKQLAMAAGKSVEEIEGRSTVDVFPKFAADYFADDLEVMSSGVPKLGIVEVVKDPDNNDIHIQTDKIPMFDLEGHVNGVVVMATNITERMRDEEKLRESESLLAATQRITHLGSWVIDLDPQGNKLTERWSDEHYRIYGFEPKQIEINDEDFFDSIHPEDRDRLANAIEDAIKGKRSFDVEHRILLPDGSERFVHAMAEIVLDTESGKPVKLLGSVQDITERRRAENEKAQLNAEIEGQRERLGNIVSSVPGVVYESWHGPDEGLRKTNFVSDYVETLLGYTVEQWLAEPNFWLSIVHPDDKERVARMTAEHGIDDDLTLEFRWLNKDGHAIWVEGKSVITKDENGRAVGVRGVTIDITERKRVEAELRESNEKFHQLADNINDAFWIRSPDLQKIYYISPAFEEIWGRPAETVYAEPTQWLKYILPEDHEFVANAYKGLMRSDATMDIEYRIVRPNGEIRWLRTRGFQVRDAKGVLIRLAGVVTDITERKKTQEALIASEERYRSVVNTAPDVIVTIDDASVITFINPAAERLFGYTTQEMRGAPLTMLMPESLRHRHSAGIARYQKTGEKHVAWNYVEVLGLHKSGREIPITISFSEFVQDGQRYFTGIIRDISELKQAMAALKESEERNRELVENAIDIIYTHDLKGNYTSVNQAGKRITGYSADESRAMNIAGMVAPEYLEKATQMIADKLAGNDTTAYEIEIIAKDGHRVLLEVNTRIVYENGIPAAVQGIARDVTERTKARQALTDSEERYRELVENAIDVIYTLDLEGNYTSMNRASEEVTGYTIEESLSRNIIESMAPEYRERAKQLLADQVHGENLSAFELEIIAKDGRRVALEIKTRPIKENGEAVGVQGIARDITERKRIAAELDALSTRTERRERMLTTLLSSMTDFAQIYERDGRLLFANQPLLDLWDKTLEEVVGKNFHDLKYPDDLAEKLQTQIDAVFNAKRPVVDETPYIGPDGLPGYYEYIFSPAIGPEGNVDFVVGSTRDVTERKLGEEKLRSNEEVLSRSQRIANLGSWELDIPEAGSVDRGKLSWSDEVFRICGYQPNELEPTDDIFFKAVHPDDRESVAEAMTAALRTGTDYQLDHRIVQPNGTERFVHEHAEIVRDSIHGRPVRLVGTMQDVTTQKQLGEQLRQSQKMEAVGVLAGGIAHDFNNLLTAINGYSDLTLRKMDVADPLRQNIQEVKNAGLRAAELTSQLLAFSRKQVLKSAVINLNTVISNIENMLRRILRESIELRTVLDPKLGNVKADAGQIEQVIMNLAINARDAMLDGGRLTIQSQNIHLDKEFVSNRLSVTAGDYVRLTVTDNGEGMDASVQPHIFDPFFTTKPVGKGTGLGLSTVYGIVKQSGGDIIVYSEPGHGTSFKIYLPCVDEIVQKPRWTVEDGRKYGGTETILLAEDEDNVRTLVREILSENGYNVLEAAGGAAALSICETYTEPIHMLLTDVIMPKMGGSELKDKVVKLLPDIKVLFMSGYADDSITDLGVLDSDTAFIEKPFTPDGLSRKVRAVLGHIGDL
jgi:two-component system, cell cycle sensor histidine kinase and response regulator CckA